MTIPHRCSRTTIVGALAALLFLTATAAQAGLSPTPVVNTPRREWEPAVAPGYLAYAQSSAARPGHFDVFVKPDASGRWRANATGTGGAHPSMEVGNANLGNVLALSQGGRTGWDLALVDLDTRDPLPIPPGINTMRAEREPSISGDHLLFARGPRSGIPYADTVILYDLTDNSKEILASADRGLVNAGAVSGDYATWQRCRRSTCFIFRRQISTGVTIRLPSSAPIVYAPTVSPDGTVFYVRSGELCGQRVKIVEVTDGTTLSTIHSFPDGVDASDLAVVPNDLKALDLYFARIPCRTFDFDVYVLGGV